MRAGRRGWGKGVGGGGGEACPNRDVAELNGQQTRGDHTIQSAWVAAKSPQCIFQIRK